MSTVTLTRKGLAACVRNYPWIYLGIGIFGNVCFVSGSILFLAAAPDRLAGGFFVAGSAGMLLGSLGSAIVHLTNNDEPGTGLDAVDHIDDS